MSRGWRRSRERDYVCVQYIYSCLRFLRVRSLLAGVRSGELNAVGCCSRPCLSCFVLLYVSRKVSWSAGTIDLASPQTRFEALWLKTAGEKEGVLYPKSQPMGFLSEEALDDTRLCNLATPFLNIVQARWCCEAIEANWKSRPVCMIHVYVVVLVPGAICGAAHDSRIVFGIVQAVYLGFLPPPMPPV